MKLKKKKTKAKMNSIVRKKLEDEIKKKRKKKGPQPNISTLKSLDSTPCLTCV